MDELLSQPDADPVLVLTEVIALAHRRGNLSSPRTLLQALGAAGLRTVPSTQDDLVRAAEELSSSGEQRERARLSLADALILAATERLGISIVTLDRHWEQFGEAGHTTARVHVL